MLGASKRSSNVFNREGVNITFVANTVTCHHRTTGEPNSLVCIYMSLHSLVEGECGRKSKTAAASKLSAHIWQIATRISSSLTTCWATIHVNCPVVAGVLCVACASQLSATASTAISVVRETLLFCLEIQTCLPSKPVDANAASSLSLIGDGGTRGSSSAPSESRPLWPSGVWLSVIVGIRRCGVAGAADAAAETCSSGSNVSPTSRRSSGSWRSSGPSIGPPNPEKDYYIILGTFGSSDRDIR